MDEGGLAGLEGRHGGSADAQALGEGNGTGHHKLLQAGRQSVREVHALHERADGVLKKHKRLHVGRQAGRQALQSDDDDWWAEDDDWPLGDQDGDGGAWHSDDGDGSVFGGDYDESW